LELSYVIALYLTKTTTRRIVHDCNAIASALTRQAHWPVVVTVIAMRVVEVTVNQIVDVVTVRNHFVAAIWTVNMARVMTAALMVWRARVRVGGGDVKRVLFDLPIGADVMHVAIVQVVNVIAVLNARVFAIRAVLVVVIGVKIRH